MADYRNGSGIVVEDGPLGPTIAIEDSSRVDPWIVRQARREAAVVYRAAGRVQPPRPTDVGRLSSGAANPSSHRDQPPRAEPRRRIDRMSHHDYATENALVDSEWALAHLDDPNVRFVEVDVDTTAYEQSHLPGAVGWNWTSQLADGIRRDIAGREDFSKLLSESGIGPDTTIVLYGDNNNWFAAWAYWQLKLYGHRDVRILNGGRKFWLDNGLALSVDDAVVSRRPATSCPSPTSACAPSATTSCRGSAIRARARRRPLAGRVQRRDHRARRA